MKQPKLYVFASNNAHKLEEVRRILSPREIHSLHEIGFEAEIDETGTTLEENSSIKARAIYEWLKQKGKEQEYIIFADDTGLEIEALHGQPGVYTARWAGEPACDANNRKKALAQLANQTNRNARFRTVITLIENGKEQQVVGEVKGIIATQESGDKGFGYDSLFIPNGYDKTFAELPAEVKNSISHRANALAKLAQIL
ncbi:MAG: RdgB/HAM1 family non-canonical purine NTP pyrophosphatase [Paludibacteraceae bacterium]|nr:RdgB/HAM1 family non-canonical purine NTP pyrophosphatase [Paludibacteraceae bacterium]